MTSFFVYGCFWVWINFVVLHNFVVKIVMRLDCLVQGHQIKTVCCRSKDHFYWTAPLYPAGPKSGGTLSPTPPVAPPFPWGPMPGLGGPCKKLPVVCVVRSNVWLHHAMLASVIDPKIWGSDGLAPSIEGACSTVEEWLFLDELLCRIWSI